MPQATPPPGLRTSAPAATPSSAPSSAPRGRFRAGRALPGLLLAFAVAALAFGLAQLVPIASPALTAIVLGALGANLGLLPDVARPGLDVAAKPVLRIGIVLLGLQLAIGDVVALGPLTIVLIIAVVTIGMLSGVLIGRALKIPAQQALLISCGFSICGAAAVAAAGGAITARRRDGESQQEADERLETRIAMAVALVVVFGSLMIPLLPLAARLMGLDASTTGTWAGASIHEVAQVVAAGELVGGGALGIAVLVKLGRVLMLAPVIAVLTGLERRAARVDATTAIGDAGGSTSDQPRSVRRQPLVPYFVLAFVVMVCIRSTGVVPDALVDVSKPVQSLFLAAAMFALGTGVRVRLLRQVGGRPAVLAALVTAIVAAVGLAGALVAA
ncbi:putative sulfate exporter family transporter [Brachybacterium endophyticum]|uniref:Putative sulfate exporter family transporter n=1 Tax=Brachybacterium endophyticum TaxID=2182385 RepID=A0A2U2RI19_9MICO|nr:putative sulfate exporter family transporter [Brachybacterium endophyticum]PWH05415.1 putative sulfate exporter family transporter [Brachybacterium endophyticum]